MLNRLALRLCVVQALLDRTFAKTAVKDSRITPVNTELPKEKAPYIAVYTDDQGSEGAKLTVEIGVTAAMAVHENGKEVIVAGLPPTDAGIEMTIDAIERQIHVALDDPENPWAELVRILVKSWKAPESLRGAAAKDGERFAGRQIEIMCGLLEDPTFGRPVTAESFWGRLLVALDANTELAPHADLIRELLGVDAPAGGSMLERRAENVTAEEADALGITPAAGASDDTVISGSSFSAEPTT